ncbi:unnamed protein product (macronuclear) [Paramecium tetraurelia]|uniref:Uncharacterized protein n=1 Tax=Paramecium tetraurelia TaxID=5888 RepID=A0DI66_PARTE|nr:uncharacterized protein GSPATT00017104001 [Paramecium tetraurelia]CAK82733.1 unnamed protein product [Paramecium tetraurelia]|eukprot:XP_001450130.1 hypothetical protein (macronuclear) [Paramecium tetraurelia strain d4-2]
MNPLLDNFRQEHKNLKSFKELIKLESKALKQFLSETIQLSIKYNSSLFDGFHYFLSKFQSDLQNQYILLKQLEKYFQKIKQDAQTCFKNLLEFDNKEFDEIDIDTNNDMPKQQNYSMILIDDVIKKKKCLRKKTSQMIEIFTGKHNFTLFNYQKSNNQENTLFSEEMNMGTNSEATILSNIIESIILDENESILDGGSSFEKQLLKDGQFHQILCEPKKQF